MHAPHRQHPRDTATHAASLEPTLVGDVTLDAPLRPVRSPDGHTRARLLVRLHDRPLGEVTLRMPAGGIDPADLGRAILAELGAEVRAHLAADGIPCPGTLVDGVPRGHRAPCRDSAAAARASGATATVVIATRDRTTSLLRCLDSLAAQDYPAFEVVVADSCPATDDTRRALRARHDWPFDPVYVRAAHPGVALAHNTALPHVHGEFTAFTDDDVEADPHWLTSLIEPVLEHDATCVTGLILPAELDTPAQLLLEQSGGFARGFSPRVHRRGDRDDPLFPYAAGRLGSGANMAFRTDWLRRRGGFDVATGTGTPARGGDDLLALLSVILDGGVLAYQPAAIVRHYHRRELAGLERQMFQYGIGLGAYLAAAVHAYPAVLPDMVRRSGAAARHFLSSGSAKNSSKADDFPAGLTWRERAGLPLGPFAYALSRYRTRQYGQDGPPPWEPDP